MIEHRSTDSSMMSDVPENCSVNQPKECPQRRSWRQHTNLLCAANVGNGLLEDERESSQGRQSPPNRSEMAKEHRFRKHASLASKTSSFAVKLSGQRILSQKNVDS